MQETKKIPRNKRTGRVLPLVHYGHPILEQKAAMVKETDDQISRLAADMTATMYNAGGIGLAAPQVGHGLRLIVIDLREIDDASFAALSPEARMLYHRMPLVLINPHLTSSSGTTESREEGCLSLPDIHAPVERPHAITFKADLIDGSGISISCLGLLARCLQHEIDHLDGITFNQRLEQQIASQVSEQLKQLRKKTRKQIKRQA